MDRRLALIALVAMATAIATNAVQVFPNKFYSYEIDGADLTLPQSLNDILPLGSNFEAPGYDWKSVDAVVETGIKDGAFPGAVGLVGDRRGILFAKAWGKFTYGAVPPENRDNPPMLTKTLFDMASCTKVSATLSAVAQFYERGELPLSRKVGSIIGAGFNQNGKTDITVLNLLLHNSGFFPDPNPFYSTPQFGCPATSALHPEEVFTCQSKIFNSLLAEKLMHPIGSTYVYSDLNFITLMYVVGQLAKDLKYVSEHDLYPGCDQGGAGSTQCYYEAYVRRHVFDHLGLMDTGFLIPKHKWHEAAPTENDTVYLHRVIQGQVSDGNAYALGGIAGHAGLFSNADDLYKLLRLWLTAPSGRALFINSTTADFFMKEYNHSQSSRAIGWNTNDPTVYDMGWNCSCGTLSPKTFMHIGYTGTEMCADPTRELAVIFLTNRVYPTDTNNKIRGYRQLFHTAVQKAYDAGLPPHLQEWARQNTLETCAY